MSIEEQLAGLFDEQARQAPAPDALLDGVLRSVSSRRRRLATMVGGTAVLGSAVVLTAGLNLSSVGAPTAGPSASGTVPAGREGRPVAVEGVAASCVAQYSPEVVAEELDFAFDGVVVRVGEPVSQRPGDPPSRDDVGVTFRVNEWFKGGSGDMITVDLPRSRRRWIDGDGPAYASGTRLLVSGMARWGGSDPLAYPIAWVGCGGFTRYFGASVADAWRAANR